MKVNPYALGLIAGRNGHRLNPRMFGTRLAQIAYTHGHHTGVKNTAREQSR